METDDVTQALRDCENRLRDILVATAKSGDYNRVLVITRIVTSIVALIPSGEQRSPGPATPTGSRRKRRSKYPRFSRRGADLVKTGWSKKEKKTYEHRANRKVVDALADAILNAGPNGRMMTTEAWLPLHVNDDEVPAYQAYLRKRSVCRR